MLRTLLLRNHVFLSVSVLWIFFVVTKLPQTSLNYRLRQNRWGILKIFILLYFCISIDFLFEIFLFCVYFGGYYNSHDSWLPTPWRRKSEVWNRAAANSQCFILAVVAVCINILVSVIFTSHLPVVVMIGDVLHKCTLDVTANFLFSILCRQAHYTFNFDKSHN